MKCFGEVFRRCGTCDLIRYYAFYLMFSVQKVLLFAVVHGWLVFLHGRAGGVPKWLRSFLFLSSFWFFFNAIPSHYALLEYSYSRVTF